MIGFAGILLWILTPLSPCLPVSGALSALPAPQEAKKVVVGPEGLALYPRFNKSLKPLARLDAGQVLLVLREFRAWKQVQVESTGTKGWVCAEVKEEGTGFGKGYDTVAAPSVAGLVARGWSKRYAASRGADFEKVEELEKRTLDAARFEKFLKEKEKGR